MNPKKLGALAALVALAFSFNVASAQFDDGPFPDVPFNYDYSEAVGYLVDEGAVQGYDDGTYRPANTINRAEFTKITLESAGVEPGGSNCFPDVTDQWFAEYVCKAKDLGLVQGYPDGNFKPERPINFIESGKIVTEGLTLPKNDQYDENWFHKYVKAVEEQEAIPPTVGTFDQYINRGEMAEMIYRVETGETDESGNYDDLKEETEKYEFTNFESCSALQESFEDLGNNYYGYGDDGFFLEEVSMDMAVPTSAPAGQNAKTSEVRTGGGEPEGEVDFSSTNVQVEGVDEADIVKTDGEFIYIVKDNKIRVVKAYHPDDMEELDALEFDDENFWPNQMYVDGDRLVVIGNSYNYYAYPARAEIDIAIWPPYYGGNQTIVYIFDISDKTDIEVFRKMTFEGDYNQSRKVDDMVYMVMNRFTFWPYEDIEDPIEILPHYADGDVSEPLVDCVDIKHAPIIESSNYLIVVGIPVQEKGDIVKDVILGQSDNIYASRDHLYVASSNWNWRSENQTTSVYKFDMSPDGVEFLAKGRVPGQILNQFSMDENGEYFRIATTRGFSWDGTSDNNVYVLDNDMNMIGKLEGIAPGETIYSTRFVGDRLYMVTFKKIDPFFVIDLANPSFPKILGKLKIPGFSDYLHPYDENHILGFGKETVDPDELEVEQRMIDFAWFQGMKVGLFDVTDVENPIEKFKVVIGDRGTDSPLLYDHKALLFDKERDIIAFPVRIAEIPEELKDPDIESNTYGDYTFQGAYVYGLDLQNGFDLKARISHYDESEVEDKAGYYWYGGKDIERLLYIGDFLYTVSKGMVMANDMNGWAEVNSVEVGPPEGEYYDFIYE